MSTATIRLCTAAVAASAALALVLTGCGDSKPAAAPATPAPGSSAPAGPAGPAALSGKSTVSVDGTALAGSFDTTCAKQGDVLALALTDNANGTYGTLAVAATVTGTGTVQAVGITGSKGGSSGLPYAVGFGKGQPGGSAQSTKSGNTFHVTGEGVGAPDMTNPTAGPKTSKFDITFSCSTIVGG
ncbi:lipoprotein LpqH [Nocardia sp. BMG111209]|uniref:lipoprotein LpqH n=1 Tax=Nocardia sp. BMG111209 TaxID=1160137 RepID=UPI00035DF841|nr:lipoprotein LpqH [Nocardia sp. BMG111209]